jgi:hypothetical protein
MKRPFTTNSKGEVWHGGRGDRGKDIIVNKATDEILFPADKSKPELPSRLEMAKNFSGSMLDWAKRGFKLRSDKEAAELIDICRGCDKLIPTTHGRRCSSCGCFMTVETKFGEKFGKVKLAGQTCPLDKW